MDGDYEDYSSKGNSSGCDESLLSGDTVFGESDDDGELHLDQQSASGNQPAIALILVPLSVVFTVSYTKETIMVGEPAEI